MSGSRLLALLAPGLFMVASGVAQAADDEVPEMEFLEYLGMWEESDEEWLLFEKDADRVASESDERIDAEPEGEESMENDDES